MTDFYLGQNDVATFVETLRDENGNPVDISGQSSILLSMTPIHGGADVYSSQAMTSLQVGDGSDGSKGKVKLASFGAGGKSSTPGLYLVRIVVHYTNGDVQTFPNTGYLVVRITPTGAAQQQRYLGVEALKNTLSLGGQSYADDDLAIAIDAASAGLESVYNPTGWLLGPTNEQRYYTANERTVTLGDAISVTSVDLDYWGGQYATPLDVANYRLLPIGRGLVADGGDGRPYQQLVVDRGVWLGLWIDDALPRGDYGVRVTGQFGWETVPSGLQWAVGLIATRLLRRSREAPFGLVSTGIDGAVMRAVDLARDADIRMALEGARPARSVVH